MRAYKIIPKLNQPRDAAETGGERQAELDCVNVADYLTQPAILDWHYVDHGEAMADWGLFYRGHDSDGVGFLLAVEAIDLPGVDLIDLRTMQQAERTLAVR